MVQIVEKGKKDSAYWDSSAEDFQRRVAGHGWNLERDPALAILKRIGALGPGARVLDVGCGVGRHLGAFAPTAGEAVGVDISARMLEFAAENLRQHANIILQVGDFKNPDAALETLLAQGFDLVFASMSPAVEDLEDLRRMSACSRGWCMVDRFLEEQDELKASILEAVGMDVRDDPHNQGERTKRLWTLLWEDGYCPQLEIHARSETFELSADALMKRYERNIKDCNAEKRERIRRILRERSENGSIRSDVHVLKATLYWDVRERRRYR